jgi:deoxyribodipyrimidine photo-lyase
MPPASIVWFRQDLRLADHPALHAAAERSGPVIPLYVWAPDEEGDWPPGAASRVWIAQSLRRLDESLRRLDSRLIIARGASLDALRAAIEATGADCVCWNRRYEPAARERDRQVREALEEDGVRVDTFNGSLLFEPWEVSTQQGEPYQVFTAFWKACMRQARQSAELPAPDALRAPETWPASLTVDDLDLEPSIQWDEGIKAAWTPGEAGAQARLDEFLESEAQRYGEGRDRPDYDGTSRLSPHLHHGEISPRQVWHAAHERTPTKTGLSADFKKFIDEIGWREFGYHLLYHFPATPGQALKDKFRDFPWQQDQKAFKAWQKGRTGYPMVDAGMRQLWEIGWMHNRARMIAASFMTKDLLIPWQEGARWFWDTLVDADLANNTLGWQWTAGCGADAAPFFRIFNPVTQGQRFDPRGEYIRQWIPELAKLPAKHIHSPWEAPDEVLEEAGVRLGRDYPAPMVDHKEARETALEAYNRIK